VSHLYLLDTNAAIAVINNKPGVRKRLKKALKGSEIALSSISLFELWYGVARSTKKSENGQRLRAFLTGRVSVVPFGDDDANHAGEIRATLEAAGTPIGPYDLLIAGQAVRLGATLVTANEKEFGRVQSLALENWETA
jgi:tRNA(fMet)-specific endonuclease VapC